MYQISAGELTTLATHLDALEQNNEALRKALDGSTLDLVTALSELSEAQRELTQLQLELKRYRKEAENAAISLQTAQNELDNVVKSLRELEQEHVRTEKRLRTQRNWFEGIAFAAIVFAASK